MSNWPKSIRCFLYGILSYLVLYLIILLTGRNIHGNIFTSLCAVAFIMVPPIFFTLGLFSNKPILNKSWLIGFILNLLGLINHFIYIYGGYGVILF